MLWLGLYLPRLALEVFQRTVDADRNPLQVNAGRIKALIPPSGRVLPQGLQLAVCNRTTVLLASVPAQALGVHGGSKRATALALAPDLIIVERDTVREQEALRQVACWALQFTPSVCMQSSDSNGANKSSAAAVAAASAGASTSASASARRLQRSLPRAGLLLEIEPSLHLFGGLDKLLTQIKLGMHGLGFTAQIGCAPTAHGAWLLATQSDGLSALDSAQLNSRLANLSIDCLDSAYLHRETLQSIGVRSIHDLLQLPRAGLARRFGSPLLAEIDRAQGVIADPKIWFEAPQTFRATLELLADVENAQALLFGARRLLLQLTGWLNVIHGALRSFQLQALHDDQAPTCLSIRLTDASRDLERLTILLREKLDITQLPAPVHTLVLVCDQITSLAAPNQELFPSVASAKESLARLVERLQTRLGREQIVRLQVAADHRPEAAYQLETIDEVDSLARTAAKGPTRVPARASASSRPAARASSANASSTVFVASLPRPLWLLPKPIAIGERNNRPYWQGAMNLLAGPERIESGWWDGALIQRDYFIAEDEHNALYWIFRERLGSADRREGWFIQGRFG